MMCRGGLREESSSPTESLEVNLKLLDSLKVVTAGDREGLARRRGREDGLRKRKSNDKE